MASASGVSGSHAPSTSQVSSGLDLSRLLEALDDSIIDERDWSEHAMRNRERRLAIRHRRFAMLSPYRRPLPINARTAEHSHAQLVIKYYQRGYLLTNERANGSYIEETPIPFVWETIRITELRGQSLRRKEDREYYARAIVKAINRMRRVPIEVLLASLEKGKAKAVEPVGGDETEPEDDDDDPEELVLPLGWSVRTLLDEVNRMLVRSGAEPYTYPMTWKRTGARPTEGSILESRQPPSEKKTELDMDDDAAATLSAMTSGRGSSTAHPSARVNAVSGPSNTQSASSFTSSSTGFFGFSIRSSNAQTAGPSNSQSNAYASRSAALPSSSSNAENSGPSGQVGGTTRLAASQSTPQPGPSQVSAAGLSNDMVDDLFENDENQPPPPPQPATIPPSQVGPTPSSSFGGDRARGVPQSQVGSSANVATSSPIPTFLPPTPLSRLSMPGVAKGQCKSNEDDRHDALSQAASQHASSFTFIPAQPSFQPAESGSFVTASASGEPMQMEEDPWTPWWANGQDDTMEGIDDDFQMMDGTQINNDIPQQTPASVADSTWVPMHNHAQKEQSTHNVDTQATPASTTSQPVPSEDSQQPWVQIQHDAQQLPLPQTQLPSDGTQQSWVPMNNHAQIPVLQDQPQVFATSTTAQPFSASFSLPLTDSLREQFRQEQQEQFLAQRLQAYSSRPFSPLESAVHLLDAQRLFSPPVSDPSVAAYNAACNFWNIISEATRLQAELTPPPAPIIIVQSTPEDGEKRDETRPSSVVRDIFAAPPAPIQHRPSTRVVLPFERFSNVFRGSRSIRPLPTRKSGLKPTSTPSSSKSLFGSEEAREASLQSRLADEKARQECLARGSVSEEPTSKQEQKEERRKRRREIQETLCDACDDRITKRSRRVDFNEDAEVFIIGLTPSSPPAVPLPRSSSSTPLKSALKKVCEKRRACRSLARKEKKAAKEKMEMEQLRRTEGEPTLVVVPMPTPQTQSQCQETQTKHAYPSFFRTITKFFGFGMH